MTTEPKRDVPRALKYRTTFRTWRKERMHWMSWLKIEKDKYASPKFNVEGDPRDTWMREGGVGPDGHWQVQVLQYVSRAHTLGLNTFAGRQALVKGLAAYTGMVESCIRVYGPLPEPGVTSGEINESQEWAPVEARY